jgi:mannosyl-oligosaccharide alpha-1,2-mannosidase
MLLGGLSQQSRNLYEMAIDTAKKNLFFRPMTPNEDDILISGNARVVSPTEIQLDPQGQHLACFVGGMLGIGSRIFDRPHDLPIARKLVDGCIWAYRSIPSSIMPETFHVVPCEDTTNCKWDEKKWYAGIESRHTDVKFVEAAPMAEQVNKLGPFPGFTDIADKRYILRYVEWISPLMYTADCL